MKGCTHGQLVIQHLASFHQLVVSERTIGTMQSLSRNAQARLIRMIWGSLLIALVLGAFEGQFHHDFLFIEFLPG